jgi:repressor LexA
MVDKAHGPYSDLKRARTQQLLLIKILELSPNGERSPTIRELTGHTGKLADSNISRALDGLENKKYIERDRVESRARQARGIWLTKRGLGWLTQNGHDTSKYLRAVITGQDIRIVPLLGEIAAGSPISPDGYIPDNDIQEYLPLPARNLPISPVFALNVRGDSMTGDGVLDGDYVVVVPYPEPKGNGEIVVALIDGDATVKRLTRDDDTYWLHPSNPEFESKNYTKDDNLLIQGRVVGVVRLTIK